MCSSFVGMTGIAVMRVFCSSHSSQCTLYFIIRRMEMSCISCANVMRPEDLRVPLRCGFDYFKQPPSLRHPERLDHYPPVSAKSSCVMWVGHDSRAVPILSD